MQRTTLENIRLLGEINDQLTEVSKIMLESLNVIASGKGVIDPRIEASETLGAVIKILSAGQKNSNA